MKICKNRHFKTKLNTIVKTLLQRKTIKRSTKNTTGIGSIYEYTLVDCINTVYNAFDTRSMIKPAVNDKKETNFNQ